MLLSGMRHTGASHSTVTASQTLRKLRPAFSLHVQKTQLQVVARGRLYHRHSRRKLCIAASAVQDLLAAGFLTTASAGLLYSAVPLLTGQAKEKNKSRSDTYKDKDTDPDDVKWGVMSVVSFIPLVNWTVHSRLLMPVKAQPSAETTAPISAGMGVCCH